MKDVMIDFETLGTTFNAVIVQIGACYFDRETGKTGDTFIAGVEIQSSLDAGFEITGRTIEWWLKQSEEAKNLVFGRTHFKIKEAILDLNDFLVDSDCVWSHATFDFVLLMNHFTKLGIKPVIPYWSARDIRTLIDLGKVDPRNFKREGVAHNALDDCLFQVKYCVEAMNKLKGR